MSTVGTQGSGSDFIGLNQAMKIIFQEPISDNVVTDSELLDLFQQDTNVTETFGGQFIQLAHYFQDAGGAGARAEGDYIPVPGLPVIQNSTIQLKKILATVQMSGEAYRRVQHGEAAFLTWAETALPKAVRRLTNQIDRMLMGYGQGIKARVASVSSNTATLTNAYGVSGLSAAHLLFQEGEFCRTGPNADGSSPRTNAGKVTFVSAANNQITFDTIPTSTATNDYIFEGDAVGNASRQGGTVDREIMGLLGMVDDGTVLSTFQGLSRSSYSLWNAIAEDASQSMFGGVLSEELLTQTDDDVFTLGGGMIDTIVTSRSGVRSYWKSLKADRIISDARAVYGGDFQGGKAKDLAILLGTRTARLRAVRKCPPEISFALETSSLKRWQLRGFVWDDTSGSIWKPVTDATGRQDAHWAYGHIEMQTGCVAPRHNAVIRNLSAA